MRSVSRVMEGVEVNIVKFGIVVVEKKVVEPLRLVGVTVKELIIAVEIVTTLGKRVVCNAV